MIDNAGLSAVQRAYKLMVVFVSEEQFVYHQSKVKKAYKYLVAFVLKDLDDSIHP
jgi:hypothetical protein